MKEKTFRMGIDIGSTTLKVCVLDETGAEVYSEYKRHNANPRFVAGHILDEMRGRLGDCRLQVAMTGSVGMGYAERMALQFEQEVLAAAEVVKRRYEGVRTFVDIGGEDSKMIFFDEGRVPDMRMNGNCAGGTGSFIDQTAALLGVHMRELDTLAREATTIYPIASRCGVFSKTDILFLDLYSDTSEANVQNRLHSCCRSKKTFCHIRLCLYLCT